MKKNFTIFVILMIFIISLNGKTVENSDIPLNKDAGRVVKLKRVLKISDESGEFYLKWPNRIKIAPDGSIFFGDDKELLKFDKNGKFLGNLQKIGEGPGEFRYFRNYFFNKDSLILFVQMPRKIIHMTLDGKLIKEVKIETASSESRNIVLLDGDNFYFLKTSFKDIGKNKTGMVTTKSKLARSDMKGNTVDSKLFFDMKMYMVKKVYKKGMTIYFDNMFKRSYSMLGDNNLLINNSLKYKVLNVDLKKMKIIGSFNRKYKHVPFKELKDNKIKGKKPKFFTDVQSIFTVGKKIWVFTSTVDKTKGVLVDVFSIDGKYIDNFYLKLPQVSGVNDLKKKVITIHKNSLYTVEVDDDENPIIVKYEIEK